MLDILIKGGIVIDPASGVVNVHEVGIKDGLIVDLGQYPNRDAREIVDASGCYVTPGIIDFHAHLYFDGTERGIYVEPTCFPSGVTTAVDGGTAGVANYPHFHNTIITNNKVRILSYLNICSLGLGTLSYEENIDPDLVNRGKIKHLLLKYSGNIRALKVRQSRTIAGGFGLGPLRLTRKIADEMQVPVVVHATDSCGETRDILDLLKPKDVFCHVFHGKGKTILDENGQIKHEIWEARARGVLFDAAHGSNQFSNRVAKTALDQGFIPDFISSDISMISMYRAPVFSMGMVMSKFLNLGLSMVDLVHIVTVRAARWLEIENSIGSLSPGYCADVAIHRLVEKEVQFNDSHNEPFGGNKLLRTEMTIREGVIVFRQIGF